MSDADQRRAFNLMHKGEFLPALSIISRQGGISWSGRQEEAFDRLVEKWKQDSTAAPDKSRFVFAYTNADVAEINAALRQVRAGQGALGRDHIFETADGALPFAENDRIQFIGTSRRADERRAGIVNGAVGTIRRIEDDGRVTVALDGKPGEKDRLVSFVAGTDWKPANSASSGTAMPDNLQGTGAHARSDLPLSQRTLAQRLELCRADPASQGRIAVCCDRDGPRSWPARTANGAGR